MNNKDIAKTATTVVADIKNIIDKGRTAAYATVNTTMIATYWNVGAVSWKKNNTARNARNMARI